MPVILSGSFGSHFPLSEVRGCRCFSCKDLWFRCTLVNEVDCYAVVFLPAHIRLEYRLSE